MEVAFQDSFDLDSREFASTGRNKCFILEPGYRLVLEGKDEEHTIRLEITVLEETRKFGRIEARVVGVKETVDGNPIEVSRNFYACCTQKHTIFYFGEEVDIYKKGKAITGFDPYSALRFQRHVLGSRAASRRRGD